MGGDLETWLRQIGLEQYLQLFSHNDVDLEVLPDLTDADLRELGLSLGHRARLRRAIELLRASAAPNGTPPRPAERLEPTQEAERRQLTIAFLDLVGSTEMSVRLDPEDMGQVITRYQQACEQAIRRYDGHVAKFLGDGVLAYFGFPRAHEDDAERAVRAALDARGAVGRVRLPDGTALQVRSGIATGLVVVGDLIGEGSARDEAVIGETPNLAARLQAVAEPDTVVIAPGTKRLLGDLFELRDLGPRQLKGFAEPLHAYLVRGESRAAGRFEAFHARTLTPILGREQELLRLLTCWERARDGEGQVVLISGEAGIGKSRLTGALRQQLRAEAGQPVRFFCSPYLTDSALRPVITQLERAARIDAADPPEMRLAKLVALLRAAGPNSDETIALIAELLSIATDGQYPSPDLPPGERKRRTLAALVGQLERLSRQHPLLVIFEDVHWSDPTTLELIDLIVEQARDLPLLLVVTHRPEFQASWAGRPQVSSIALSRLARDSVVAIMEGVAGGKPLPPEVIEEIRVKTDGVPLFVEELTKTVLESGYVRETEQAFVLDHPLPPLAIPTTLHDSLMARLDRLAPVKEVAQIAAVIGREFPHGLLLGAVGCSEAELEAALDRLIRSELIFAHGRPPQAVYTFKHALVRDAAYASLLRGRRQHLHGVVARSLESADLDAPEKHPELLAHHYTEAGLDGPALGWWRSAGEQAIRRSANVEAIRHLDKALAILARQPESRERDLTELAIRIPRSGPLIAVGGYVSEELETNYARAGELCDRTGATDHPFPVMYGQWVIPFVRGDMRLAVENGRRFLERARAQDDDALVMVGHRLLGSGLVWHGAAALGQAHLERALAMFESGRHDSLAFAYSQHPKVAALAHLCLGLQHQGHLDRAMAAGQEAIAEARRQAHFNSMAYALCFASLLIMLRRDAAMLRDTAGELLRISEAHDAAYWKSWAKIMLAWIRAEEGELEEGLAVIRRNTGALQEQKANVWVPQSLLLKAELRLRRGELDAMGDLLEQAGALILPLEQLYYEVEWRRLQAKLLVARRAPVDEALQAFERALETARRQASPFFELRVAADMARAPELREAHGGLERLRAAYAHLTDGFATADLIEARRILEGSA